MLILNNEAGCPAGVDWKWLMEEAFKRKMAKYAFCLFVCVFVWQVNGETVGKESHCGQLQRLCISMAPQGTQELGNNRVTH